MIQEEASLTLAERLINVCKWCGGNDNSSTLIFTNLGSLACPTDLTGNSNVEKFQVWDVADTVEISKTEIY